MTLRITLNITGIKEGRIQMADFGSGTDKATREIIDSAGLAIDKFEDWGKAIAEGGDKGQVAMLEATKSLAGVRDETARNQLGTKMFGTMWEDQGTKIIDTILKAEEKQVDLKENTDNLNDSMAQLDSNPLVMIKQATSDLLVTLSPLLTMIAEVISMIASWAQNNSTLAAIIVTVSVALGILLAAVLALSPVIASLTAAAIAAEVTIAALVAPFLAVAAVVAAVIAVIALLVAAFINLYNKNEEFRSNVQAIWTSIQEFFFIALDYIRNLVITIMTEVATFFGEILSKIKTFWDENGQQIMAVVSTFMNITWTIIQTVMNVIVEVFKIAWTLIQATVKYTWETIKLIIRTGVDLILGAIQTMLKILRGDWEGAWNSIKQTLVSIWNNITSFLEGIDLAGTGKQIIQGLINGISSMGGAIWDSVKSIGSSIKDGFTDFFDINSPSRMMRDKIGKYIGEGLAIGIQRSTNIVDKASRAMQEAATPNVTNQSKQQGANASMPSLQINPAPVMIDGYEFAKITFDYFDGMIQDRVQNALSRQG
ncbi:hypothetical protein [Niallia sp. RD1]|uniref:phage tail protein n=1 Tax=Niallia sp. RD1 TaxID=2962858 RepID=UPI0020C1AEC4|nr:hypothetical protein [Niallia sp. RD1]UTI42098.1 hypothetical protein NKG37_25345 [Niallia sp. RD1]